MQGAMNNMQQRVYRPPNVAGWEGGMSWLNTEHRARAASTWSPARST